MTTSFGIIFTPFLENRMLLVAACVVVWPCEYLYSEERLNNKNMEKNEKTKNITCLSYYLLDKCG